jgi:hypothetical protein
MAYLTNILKNYLPVRLLAGRAPLVRHGVEVLQPVGLNEFLALEIPTACDVAQSHFAGAKSLDALCASRRWQKLVPPRRDFLQGLRQGVRPHKSRREVLWQRLQATQFPSRKATMTDTPPIADPPRTHAGRDRHRGQAQEALGPGRRWGDESLEPTLPPMAVSGRLRGCPNVPAPQARPHGTPVFRPLPRMGAMAPAGPIPPDRSCSAGNSPAQAPPFGGATLLCPPR